MMRLFLNGLAASAGGGLTYLRNVIPELSARNHIHTVIVSTPRLRQEFGDLPNVAFLELKVPAGATRRFWQEQTLLPRLIRQSRADVFISAGNFALRKSPVPQILLSRNSLYTSATFSRDLRRRGEYGMWLQTHMKGLLAKRSIHRADCTIAPTQAFAQELRDWTGCDVIAVQHGFDGKVFFQDKMPLPANLQQKLGSEPEAVRLLHVSHYNYYRNFETLFRALPLLREPLHGRKIKLFLTCRLRSEENPGNYRADAAAALVTRLGIADSVVELGTVPYSQLHQLYRASNVYVTAAYTESFAHPLVEAMASGLPVVAADLSVHREVCGNAALYFQPLSPQELAGRVLQITASGDLSRELRQRGLARSRGFSWSEHVTDLLGLAENLLAIKRGENQIAFLESKIEGSAISRAG